MPIVLASLAAVLLVSAQLGRSDEVLGLVEARAQMRQLEHMIGSFALDASETATDSFTFFEKGIRVCRSIFSAAAILCEDERTLVVARDRYEQLPSHRRSLTLFRWNSGTRRFERLSIRPDGPPTVQSMAFESERRVLSYTSVVESRSTGLTLHLAGTMTIRRDEHEAVERLHDRSSPFREEYRERATRR